MRAKAKPSKLDAEVLELRREQAVADIRAVLGTPQGRRFYWRLLEKANVFGASFTDSAARTAYLEGKRGMGIELMQEVQRYAPADHVLTLNEQLALQREDESRRRMTEAQAENDDGN